MKVAVIGNGTSWEKYDGWGDAVVGCSLGAPIEKKYEFNVLASTQLFKRVIEDSWNHVPKANIYIPPHEILHLKAQYSKKDQKIIIDNLNIVIDLQIIKSFPSCFHLNFARIKGLDQQSKGHGNAYLGQKRGNFSQLTTGHWAIIYAIHKLNPTYIKCWGFDAHIDYTTKFNTLSWDYTHDSITKNSNKHGGLSDMKSLHRAKLWPETFEFIQGLYPDVNIEIVQ